MSDAAPKHDPQPSPQRIAEAVRDGMFANDHASRGLGMQIEAVGPGYARIVMTVRRDMLNGFAICAGSDPVGAQSHRVENVAPNGIVHHIGLHLRPQHIGHQIGLLTEVRLLLGVTNPHATNDQERYQRSCDQKNQTRLQSDHTMSPVMACSLHRKYGHFPLHALLRAIFKAAGRDRKHQPQ